MIKSLNQVQNKIEKDLSISKPVICDYVMMPKGPVKYEESFLSTDKICDLCSGKEHYTPYFDPKVAGLRVWLCANPICDVYTMRSRVKVTKHTANAFRALQWPLFCEMNTLGDENYNVKFEDINQTEGKISYMVKFIASPRGILFMQGDPGTGKTFAALAICELFTRKDVSCIFTTQKQMSNNWLETFKPDRFSNYIEKVSTCSLLVIDDFGTGEVNPKFIEFFMELINTRMQWSNRGTVITTNLQEKEFNKFCGEALSDRILTGQRFEFKGKSRRKKTVL